VYDSGNIYTFDFVAMQEIITALYQKYCCYWIFLDCNHIMQWELYWVQKSHIWYVQEPILWINGSSHSIRMWDIAKMIKLWKTYKDACFLVWVQSDSPYLIDEKSDIWKKHKKRLDEIQKRLD
jgi:hypothetical protein